MLGSWLQPGIVIDIVGVGGVTGRRNLSLSEFQINEQILMDCKDKLNCITVKGIIMSTGSLLFKKNEKFLISFRERK